ncbi:MAG: LacI family transcriptional regulator [Microbacterium hominis]|uniref:substrate-binding domain-containing protein n=1 Tax=Microbacterium aurum TaxID=36805 RepID=UPI00248E6286|nr:LacI family DNA-binding transcriptional regulator [Microbacterium aurum]MBZ6372030.1 LacI family transcriptional regulator [Microbacterium hominis]
MDGPGGAGGESRGDREEAATVVAAEPAVLIAAVVERAGEAPTAVCCANDRLAVDLIGRAFDAGIRVPDALSVAGYDDIDLASKLRPTLTSVDQPRRDMGALALRQLTDMLAGNPARHEVATPTLVVRESTAQVA